MINWKNIALILTGVLIGCAGGAAGTVLANRPAQAPRFDHMCMGPSGGIDGINEDVDKAGREGWELVTMTGGIVCFKRPL